MRRFNRRGRARRVASLVALLVVLVGLGLVGYALLAGDSPAAPPVSGAADPPEGPSAPSDTTMKLDVPKMSRVKDITVRTAPVSDTTALEAGAQHLKGTGYPWQEVANVYIAGHRLGYPGTDSYLVFYDLHVLRNGDEIVLTDSDGARYTYSVFKRFTVGPNASHITRPKPGANIVTLQTCTLPDYADRFVVQGELVSVA